MAIRKIRSKSDQTQPKTTAADGPRSRRSFEWPLLVYPVLFLATLVILHVMGRSIEKESATSIRPPRATQEQPNHVAPNEASDPAAFLSGLAPRAPESNTATTPNENPTPQDKGAAGPPGRARSVVGQRRHAVDLSQLKGPARTVAVLCIAVDEKDHVGVKRCIAELVAMGDEAVAPLRDLIAKEEGEAALWAATALARIGTPGAAGALLDRLSQTGEGAYKEELGKRASRLNNHDSWPLLLDIMMQANDGAVVRAAGDALSGMADAPVIDEVIARYDTASTEVEIDRLAQLVRNIRSPQASESLLSLAGPATAAPQDSLQQAAIEALARVGNAQCVSHLLQRLEASPPGEDVQIFNTITRIDSPDAQASLLYAAAGNKEVSAEHGRTAAIYALKNYPNEQTVALLERILAQEQNEKVLTAAARTLDNLRRGPYTLATKAESLQMSEAMLPFPPLEK